MPNWIKRVSDERRADLDPDEQVIAATYFQARGSATGTMVFGTIGGVVGGAIGRTLADQQQRDHLERRRAELGQPENSIADALPADHGVLAITDRRMIVFGFRSGGLRTKILDPVLDIPVGQLTGWSYQPGRLASVVNLAFDDRSATGIEIPRANRPDRFADLLGIPRTSS